RHFQLVDLDGHRRSRLHAKCEQRFGDFNASRRKHLLAAYSARRAEIGSTEAARRAGKKLASNADAPNMAATEISVAMSHGGVPKSNLRISEAARIAHPVPITIPASASTPASLKMRR